MPKPIRLITLIILCESAGLVGAVFTKVNKTAAYLLYPYLAWVSFASLLNLGVALLNP